MVSTVLASSTSVWPTTRSAGSVSHPAYNSKHSGFELLMRRACVVCWRPKNMFSRLLLSWLIILCFAGVTVISKWLTTALWSCLFFKTASTAWSRFTRWICHTISWSPHVVSATRPRYSISMSRPITCSLWMTLTTLPSCRLCVPAAITSCRYSSCDCLLGQKFSPANNLISINRWNV